MTTHQEVKFEASDYRDLLDVLIDANVTMDREQREALHIKVGGKSYNLAALASLINQTVGYETQLTAAHDERLNADYHNRIIKKRQYGYGRTARNLADRALGIGAFGSPSPAMFEAERRIAGEAAKKAALEEAALAAHPGWREITDPILTVGGRTFVKTDKKAPGTLNGLVKWFERTHPDEDARKGGLAIGDGEEKPAKGGKR